MPASARNPSFDTHSQPLKSRLVNVVRPASACNPSSDTRLQPHNLRLLRVGLHTRHTQCCIFVTRSVTRLSHPAAPRAGLIAAIHLSGRTTSVLGYIVVTCRGNRFGNMFVMLTKHITCLVICYIEVEKGEPLTVNLRES
jgi:hypothetical protein